MYVCMYKGVVELSAQTPIREKSLQSLRSWFSRSVETWHLERTPSSRSALARRAASIQNSTSLLRYTRNAAAVSRPGVKVTSVYIMPPFLPSVPLDALRRRLDSNVGVHIDTKQQQQQHRAPQLHTTRCTVYRAVSPACINPDAHTYSRARSRVTRGRTYRCASCAIQPRGAPLSLTTPTIPCTAHTPRGYFTRS